MEGWVPGPEAPQPGQRPPGTAEVVTVLRAPQRDIVTEPLHLLVRVGVARDVDQERGEVDRRALVALQGEVIAQAKRDHRLPEHVLHRLPEPEIDAERQGSEEVVSAGDVFYMAPGHVPEYQPGTRIIQFSPTDQLQVVTEAIMRNQQHLQPS